MLWRVWSGGQCINIGSTVSVRDSKKLTSPSAENNKLPILEVLQKHFDKTSKGRVLEIASGSGQHISYFASHFPMLIFQPSECDTSCFDSIEEYAKETPTKNVKNPIKINVADDWTTWNISKKFDYAININMIHIVSFSCTKALFENISAILKMNGLLITYGPYSNNGVLTPQSNRDFNKILKRKDPESGIRDIQDLIRVADPCGINLVKMYDMPANNKCLIWKKVQKF